MDEYLLFVTMNNHLGDEVVNHYVALIFLPLSGADLGHDVLMGQDLDGVDVA